jgi:hypothetical protein
LRALPLKGVAISVQHYRPVSAEIATGLAPLAMTQSRQVK